MAREGQAKPLTFDLVRDEIPHPSVDLAFEIRPNVGYMHVTNFQETTAREVGDALDKFRADGPIKGLVIDLRGNPGGLVNQAVDMCDKFLQKGSRSSSRSAAAPPPIRSTPPHAASRAKVSRRRPGQPQHRLRRRDRFRRPAGSRPRPHRRRNHLSAKASSRPSSPSAKTPASLSPPSTTTPHPAASSSAPTTTSRSTTTTYVRPEDRHQNQRQPRGQAQADDGRTVYGGGGITPDQHIDELKSRSRRRRPR